MKARFPERRGWKLGKSEKPLKKAIDAMPSRHDLQTKQPNVFIPTQPIYFGARPNQRNFSGFSILHTWSLNSETPYRPAIWAHSISSKPSPYQRRRSAMRRQG